MVPPNTNAGSRRPSRNERVIHSRRRKSDDAGTSLRKPSKDSLNGRRHSVDPSSLEKNKGKPISIKAKAVKKTRKGGGRSIEERKSRKEILLKIAEERKEKLQQKKAIFNEEWMNKCYEQVIYPKQSCAEVSFIIEQLFKLHC